MKRYLPLEEEPIQPSTWQKRKARQVSLISYILATGHQFALKKLYFTRGEVPPTILREIRNLMACTHENVLQLKEVVLSSSKQFSLVLEHCEMDLHVLYESTNLLGEPAYRKDVFSQMLHALAYLEESFILHRDVKLSNFLLTNTGCLKLADFGLSRYVPPSLDPPSKEEEEGAEDVDLRKLSPVVVTLWYRAPEILLADPNYSFPIDMWSFGCVFGEILLRRPLFCGISDIDQMTKIFELLGTPTDELQVWPGFSSLPVREKFSFYDLPGVGLGSLFEVGEGEGGVGQLEGRQEEREEGGKGEGEEAEAREPGIGRQTDDERAKEREGQREVGREGKREDGEGEGQRKVEREDKGEAERDSKSAEDEEGEGPEHPKIPLEAEREGKTAEDEEGEGPEQPKTPLTAPEFDLLSGCLVYYPKHRLKAAEALQHPYFSSMPCPRRLDMAEAVRQYGEWVVGGQEEKGEDSFVWRREEGEDGRGFAARLAQFLGEEDDTVPIRKALFANDDSDEDYL